MASLGLGVKAHNNISSNFESFRFTHSFCLVNLHKDCCHVVTAKSLACSDVAGAAVIKQLGHRRRQITHWFLIVKIVFVCLLHHEIDCLLARLDVPDSVTRKYHELCAWVDGLDTYVRESWDSLVLGLKLSVTLVLKIAKGTRKCEHAVNTALFDKATCTLDAGMLLRILRLMVFWHIHSSAGLWEDSARITCIGADDLGPRH